MCPKKGLTLWRACRIPSRVDMPGEVEPPFRTKPSDSYEVGVHALACRIGVADSPKAELQLLNR